MREVSASDLSQPGILQDDSWRAVDWLVHGFTLRTGGHSAVYGHSEAGDLNLGFTSHDDRKSVEANRKLLIHALAFGKGIAPEGLLLVTLTQIHSANVYTVSGSASDPANAVFADGLITQQPGMLLAIQTADCVPVLVVDPVRRAAGAFHAGWRGTAKRIVERGIQQMEREFGCEPESLQAVIGPAIGSCCYPVGTDVQTAFRDQFPYADELMTSTGKETHLDLRAANRRQLLQSGLLESSVRMMGGCTSCHPELYFSYRQSKGFTGRMMSVAGILP